MFARIVSNVPQRFFLFTAGEIAYLFGIFITDLRYSCQVEIVSNS